MKPVRLFFCLKRIYFKQTLIQILVIYIILWAFGSLALFSNVGEDKVPTYISVPITAIVIYFFLRTLLRTWIVDHLLEQYPDSLIPMSAGEMGHSSANLELDKFDRLTPISNYHNANLFIATFDFYRHTKNGDYLAKQAYYTVLELPLDRKLHIFYSTVNRLKGGSLNIYI
jgi:hypothetical protein